MFILATHLELGLLIGLFGQYVLTFCASLAKGERVLYSVWYL